MPKSTVALDGISAAGRVVQAQIREVDAPVRHDLGGEGREMAVLEDHVEAPVARRVFTMRGMRLRITYML